MHRLRALFERYQTAHADQAGAVSVIGARTGFAVKMRWFLLLMSFLMNLMQACPAVIGWVITRRLRYRAKVKTLLRLGPASIGEPLQRLELCDPLNATLNEPGQSVTIVLRVTNDLREVKQCAESIDRFAGQDRLVAIPVGQWVDQEVRSFLNQWAGQHPDTTVIEVEHGSSQIMALNRCFAHIAQISGRTDGALILLEADAILPPDWISRLISPLLSDSAIATTSPMSNRGGVLSVPVIEKQNQLCMQQADAIDALARRMSPQSATAIPAACGNCLAISNRWLTLLPELDPAFQTIAAALADWSQQTAYHGGKHLGIPNLFVGTLNSHTTCDDLSHRPATDDLQLLSARHPNYARDVQRFIRLDPLRGPRLALGTIWAGADAGLSVYLGHSMGGGAEYYLQHRIENDLNRDKSSVVLRIGGARRWQVELVTPSGTVTGQSDETDCVRQLARLLPKRHIVYSCGVGDRDPAEIPDILLSMMQPQDSAELLFHDYFPLTPSYNLLDRQGNYHHPATPANPATRPQDLIDDTVDLSAWQAAWEKLARRSTIVAFSESSKSEICNVWPHLADQITIRPHRLHHPVTDIAVQRDTVKPVLGVLGNIGPHKGAGVVVELGRKLRGKPNAPGIALIGNIDPAYALPDNIRQHGAYSVQDLPRLTNEYQITHWLIPSVWPETFCYTVREALATGLPVLAFGIGAQGEAVRNARNGTAMPFESNGDLARTVLITLAKRNEADGYPAYGNAA